MNASDDHRRAPRQDQDASRPASGGPSHAAPVPGCGMAAISFLLESPRSRRSSLGATDSFGMSTRASTTNACRLSEFRLPDDPRIARMRSRGVTGWRTEAIGTTGETTANLMALGEHGAGEASCVLYGRWPWTTTTRTSSGQTQSLGDRWQLYRTSCHDFASPLDLG